MKNTRLIRALVVLLSALFLAGFGFSKKTPNQERQEVLEMRDQVLAKLYAEAPGAEEVLAEAAGYAVFSSLGVNVLLVSTARGQGVLRNNATGEDVYMKMFSAGGGVGMGVKDFDLVFVFDTQEAITWFTEEGWAASAQADAAAKHEGDGEAAALAFDVAPGVYLYQMTESGLALQATIQGTKYMKDKDLN